VDRDWQVAFATNKLASHEKRIKRLSERFQEMKKTDEGKAQKINIS
jgi:hypothetical protein